MVGLKYPKVAAMFGGIIIFGRCLYAKGYRKSPKKRVGGAIVAQFTTMATIFTAIAVSIKFVL